MPEINPVINMVVFGIFVAVTLFIVFRVSRRKATENEFYAAGRSFSGRPSSQTPAVTRRPCRPAISGTAGSSAEP